MRFRTLLPLCGILASLAFASQPSAEQLGIIGKDDRRVLASGDGKWAAVGRVERGGRGFCTGVLVAPTEVLTAAHCLWSSERRQMLAPSTVHFVAGFRRGDYVAHGKGKNYRLDPDLTFDPTGRPNRLALDWAVIELDAPINGIPPIPVAHGAARSSALATNGTLFRIGYGRDRPYLPVIVKPCRPLAVFPEEAMLLHDCDATLGDSGSPVLLDGDDGWQLVALQVAVVAFESAPVGAAVLLGRRIPADILR